MGFTDKAAAGGPGLYLELSAAYYDHNAVSALFAEFQRLARRHPVPHVLQHLPRIRYNLALAYTLAPSRRPQAIREYRKAIAEFAALPTGAHPLVRQFMAFCHHNLAHLYLEAGALAKAKEALTRAQTDLDPAQYAAHLLNLEAEIALVEGHPDMALEKAEASRKHPSRTLATEADASVITSLILRARGRVAEAEEFLTTALRLATSAGHSLTPLVLSSAHG